MSNPELDYRFIAIDDGTNADATYWPIASGIGAIAHEGDDGQDLRVFRTSAVSVFERRSDTDWRPLIMGPSLVANVNLTDSRLTLVSEKFTKGPGYGEILYLPDGAHDRSSGRLPRKVHLVGQLRHEHVGAILFRYKAGLLTSNEVEAIVVTFVHGKTVMTRKLSLSVKRNVDPREIAEDWARRIRTHRMAMEGLTDEDRADLEAATFVDRGEGVTTHSFPGMRFVE